LNLEELLAMAFQAERLLIYLKNQHNYEDID